MSDPYLDEWRHKNATIANLQTKLRQIEAERDRLFSANEKNKAYVLELEEEQATAWFAERERARGVEAALALTNERYRKFELALEVAYQEHLQTGDYTPLGIAAQEALIALWKDEE